MNLYTCLACLCLGIVAAAPQLDRTLDAQWYHWKSQHGKTYAANEDNWRRATWEKNLRMIEKHNLEYSAGKHSFHMKMNKFGDMTSDEFRQMMNGFRQNRFLRKSKGTLFHEPLLEQTPKSVDWRDKGYVTPVKSQGHCGSCWAFSATGSLEGQWFRKTGKLVSLSEQNLIDCATGGGSQGCNGGFMDSAFEYVMLNGGIDTEESYPYEAMDGDCRYQPENAGANVTGFVDIPSGQEMILTKAVATVGPISIGIDASLFSFQFYHGGVYYDPLCSSEQLDHGVLAVGYGVDEETGNKYWIVKNSWGDQWGNNGYILMARDKSNHCGIATAASYPEV
ncbi:cathepsin L2-like [Phascolarctos cinereus]|uniref:Cathepsin L1-like n=1 Tax=Phascolarctos cinereus TaxID=38626 RepID=A0A6P5IZ26_PHACI|nr:cathepsin L1-like [Phascolarctos cinereus]